MSHVISFPWVVVTLLVVCGGLGEGVSLWIKYSRLTVPALLVFPNLTESPFTLCESFWKHLIYVFYCFYSYLFDHFIYSLCLHFLFAHVALFSFYLSGLFLFVKHFITLLRKVLYK